MHKVRIQLEAEGFCDYSGPTEMELSDTIFNALCRIYGTPGLGWYPVSTTVIKAFSGQRWLYLKPQVAAGGWHGLDRHA